MNLRPSGYEPEGPRRGRSSTSRAVFAATAYLKQLLPLLRPGGTVIAHNIDPARADPAYLQAISTNPDLDTVFANFGSGGLSVTLKKR